jgi:YD repeat-containing protein
MNASSIGSLTDSDQVNPSSIFHLTAGKITSWQLQVQKSPNTMGITTISPSGYDVAYALTLPATYTAYGILFEPPSGLWINSKSLGAPCDNPGGVACGNPINIATGNKYEQVSDFETAGQNKLSFIRYYNSMAVADTYADELGPNWRSNYDRYLYLVSSTEVQAERADGQIINFFLSGGVWTTASDVDMTLTNTGATWTLTDHDDTVETYTASGAEATLQTIKLRNGYTQTLNYTSSVLTGVSDSYSRSLGFTYTSGMLTGVTTPDSLTLTYGYTTVSGSSLLTSVSYNTSPVTSQTYLYENISYPFALTGITDENGNRYATWAYDGTGRATSSQHGTGTTIADYMQVSYDDTTGNRTVTGPLGIQETYKFTTLQGLSKVSEIDRAANGTVAAATRTFGYDTNGYLNASTDWDTNSTTYVNNAHGDPTTINEAVAAPVARTTTIAYDTTWVHLPHTITTPGTTTTDNYDATTGNLLTQVLTDTTTQTIPYSTNGQTRTTTYTYTATGQLHTVQLPRTDVVAKTTYAYTGGTLTSITDPLSHVTTINTYTGGGLPLTITDPNSVLTTLAYDSRLRLHTKIVTISGGSLTTTWDHDAAGNLTKLTQPDATYLSYAFDNAHRLNKITNANGELMPLTLDGNSDVTQVLWQTATPVTKRTNTATYDALGRRLTAVGGMSQTTNYGYDSQSNLTSIETPLTWTTGRAFDALNRLKTVTDPVTHTTGYTYDAHDLPLTVTDPNGHATTYIYDGFGEPISVASPDSGTTVYHFDNDGNVSSKTDALSAVTNWTYDAMDRPLTRAYPAGAALNVAYTYDQTGHGKGITRLTSLTDQAGSLSLSYDESGNITSNARTISAIVYTTGYAYYGQRLLDTITYPTGGWIATYAIDAAGALNLVEVLTAIRKAGRQVIVAVEDPALADVLCRRLRSSTGDIGRLFELHTSKTGGAEIEGKHDIYPMPQLVLRPAQAS